MTHKDPNQRPTALKLIEDLEGKTENIFLTQLADVQVSLHAALVNSIKRSVNNNKQQQKFKFI